MEHFYKRLSTHQKMALAFVALSFTVLIIRIFGAVCQDNSSLYDAIFSPFNWVLLGTIVLELLAVIFDNIVTRYIIIVIVWAMAIATSQDTTGQQFISIFMYIIAFGLVYKSGFLATHFWLKVVAMFAVMIGSIVANPLLQARPWLLVNLLVFVTFGMLILYIRFEEEIKLLKKRVEKLQHYEPLGASAAAVLHSFKAIASAMTTASDGISRGELEYVEVLEVAIKEMRDRIHEVNRYTAISEDRNKIEEFDAVVVVNSIVRLHRVTPNVIIHVSTVPGEEKKIVHANAFQFKMAVENIIQNSIEAMDKGGYINIRFRDNNIFFSDTGPGIPKCVNCKPSNSCSQCTKFAMGRTTKTNGTGIGIVQIQDFCRDSGWDLHIYSWDHDGTEFQFVTK